MGRRSVGRLALEAQCAPSSSARPAPAAPRAAAAHPCRAGRRLRRGARAPCRRDRRRRPPRRPAARRTWQARPARRLGKEALDAIALAAPAGPARVQADRGAGRRPRGGRRALRRRRWPGHRRRRRDRRAPWRRRDNADGGHPLRAGRRRDRRAHQRPRRRRRRPAADGARRPGLATDKLEEIASARTAQAVAEPPAPWASSSRSRGWSTRRAPTTSPTCPTAVTGRSPPASHLRRRGGTVLISTSTTSSASTTSTATTRATSCWPGDRRILAGHGVAGRLGGDEFAVMTSAPEPDGAVAARILADVARAFPHPRCGSASRSARPPAAECRVPTSATCCKQRRRRALRRQARRAQHPPRGRVRPRHAPAEATATRRSRCARTRTVNGLVRPSASLECAQGRAG